MGRTSDAKERLMAAILDLIWAGSYGTTTIDQICEKAGVKKGSFYYFFKSKADLAVAALDASWQEKRAELDALFSATVPPLERIQRYGGLCLEKQEQLKCECGFVLGCPLFTLGSEICTQETELRAKVEEILEQHRRYLETAIRDAHAAGLIQAPDAAAKSRVLGAYFEGVLTQARIQNDLAPLREMPQGMMELLGVPEAVPA
jgi:TetR/AcrR family transcriptional repressor of nem operon